MPSATPGFEYDIFISYRHNDNRSGWVTDFVNALQEELAATIKEPLSVYFDKNPHDGLLETHHVDKSLEGKLKCRIFIPILSQTYCDAKSFAWQYEFCAFNRLSKEDQLGRDIRLTNGNVASRILPVRIHDLDAVDKATVEREIGGVVRSIDFIFRSPGVNRPLRAVEDHPNDNQNKTVYRDQINKVANTIKELMVAMQHPVPAAVRASVPVSPAPRQRKSTVVIAAVLAVILLSVVGYYFAGREGGSDLKTDKSIAVLPFKNMSGDKEQDYFSDGMMDEILNQLVKIGDLKVSSRTSSMQYRDSKLSLKEIASELSVAHVLEGSVQRSGDRVRIIVQLIDAATDKHLWSESYDRNLHDVFAIQTEISKSIAQQLNIVLSPEDRTQLEYVPTRNQQAYDYYLKAKALNRDGNPLKPIDLLDKAIVLDSGFALAYAMRALMFGNWFFNRYEHWEDKAWLAQDDLSRAMRLSPDQVEVKINHAWVLYLTERRYDDAISILEGLKQEYPKNVEIYQALGSIQRRKGLWRESFENFSKALGLDSGSANLNHEVGRSYHAVREYGKAIMYFKKSRSNGQRLNSLLCQGKLNEAVKLMEELFTKTGNPWFMGSVYYYKREFRNLLEDKFGIKQFSTKAGDFTYPELYYLMNDAASSKKYALRAVESLEKESRKSPGDYYLLRSLGLAYAYAGDSEKAIEAGRRALELMPVSRDAFIDGPANEFYLAKIFLICGRYDECMDKLEYLLTIPNAVQENISVELLKIDPLYDRLRHLPRFQKILQTEYKTVY